MSNRSDASTSACQLVVLDVGFEGGDEPDTEVVDVARCPVRRAEPGDRWQAGERPGTMVAEVSAHAQTWDPVRGAGVGR